MSSSLYAGAQQQRSTNGSWSERFHNLCGGAVEVLCGLAARGDRRLGETLVLGRRPRRPGELADGRAVQGDEGIELFEARDLHGVGAYPRMPSPTIDELLVADPPAAWLAAGFDVDGDAIEVGSIRIRLAGPGSGRGIVGCTVRGLTAERPDGLPASASEAPPREPRSRPQPNGVVALDHLVAFSPSLERTVAELEGAGIELRRLREEPTPAGAPRQAFFRLGEVILEVIQTPPGSREEGDPDAPARFWGLAFQVADLDATADHLGDRLGGPRDAVQPGRRIATLRREAGLGPAVAFMTPAPAGA